MADELSGIADVPPAAHGPTGSGSPARTWFACLAAGVVAGLIGFGAGEAAFDVFQPRSVKQQLGPGEFDRPTMETKRQALIANSSLAFGAWGAILGAALGLGGAAAAGRAGRGAAGAVVGAVAGGLVGVALPFGVITVAQRARFEMGVDPMVTGASAVLAMWSLTAAAAAIGFAVGGRRPVVPAVAAALLGAVGGTVIYLALSTFLYPLAETDQPMPLAWQARLLARLLPAVGAAALLARVRPAPAREAVAG